MRSLEPIYAAIFALAQAANTQATPFSTMSRRWVSWDQTNPEQCPALFQLQRSPKLDRRASGVPRISLPVDWYVYLPSDPADLVTVTSTVINNYMTALLNAILPTLQGDKQTLGGLVYDAYVDGDITLDEGLLSSPAVFRVPIIALTGL
jgi:hypothetical protein